MKSIKYIMALVLILGTTAYAQVSEECYPNLHYLLLSETI